MVCGSIGYGGVNKIREYQEIIKKAGFIVHDHISEKGMDYSGVEDFRDKNKLARAIVKHDLKHIDKVDIVVAIPAGPSYGTAVELYVAKQKGKKIIFVSENKVPSPWPIAFSDYVVKNKEELLPLLQRLVKVLSNKLDKKRNKKRKNRK